MHYCPMCNEELLEDDIEICPNCNYDFNEVLTCAYKLSGKCVHTSTECSIKGLDFESCETYLHKAGLKR